MLLSALALIVVFLTTFNATCSRSQLQTSGRTFEAVAQEAQRSTGELVKSGDMSSEDARAANAVLYEFESSAHVFNLALVNYESLSPQAKRELLQTTIDESVRIISRLEDQNVIRFKTERGRQKFDKWLSRIKIGTSALRIALAALPQDSQQVNN
jgi:hypothetical protein